MVGGGILTAFFLVPMIAYFGDGLPGMLPPGQQRIAQLSAGAISGQYVRYIGAGAVAAGGVLSMLNALPLILELGGRQPARHAFGQTGRARRRRPHRSRLADVAVVVLGSLGLVLAIALSHLIPTDLTGRLIGAGMIVLFGFLFVTVSSRITGVIGSSSNPISGMTIATLLADVPDLRRAGLGRAGIPSDGTLDRGGGVRRLVQRRNNLARPQDRIPGRRDALEAAGLDTGRCLGIRRLHGRHIVGIQPGLYDRHRAIPADLPTIKAPAAEIKGHRDRAGWQELSASGGLPIPSRACSPASTSSTKRYRPGS